MARSAVSSVVLSPRPGVRESPEYGAVNPAPRGRASNSARLRFRLRWSARLRCVSSSRLALRHLIVIAVVRAGPPSRPWPSVPRVAVTRAQSPRRRCTRCARLEHFLFALFATHSLRRRLRAAAGSDVRDIAEGLLFVRPGVAEARARKRSSSKSRPSRSWSLGILERSGENGGVPKPPLEDLHSGFLRLEKLEAFLATSCASTRSRLPERLHTENAHPDSFAMSEVRSPVVLRFISVL